MKTVTILALIVTVIIAVIGGLISAASAGRPSAIGWDTPPVLKHFVKPIYPALAREAGIEGTARVKVVVGTDGRVIEAKRIRSNTTASMDKAAVAAARQCEFSPAKLDGKPVEAAVMIPFNFRLEKRPKKIIRHTCSCRREEISIRISPEVLAKFSKRMPEPEPESAPVFAFRLDANYPNPFNPSTVIPYEVASTSRVRLNVYNVRGQLVRTLVDAQKNAGAYRVRWDGTSASGSPVASGVYFYRITAGSFMTSRKMLLLK